jgi:hypothetical protein
MFLCECKELKECYCYETYNNYFFKIDNNGKCNINHSFNYLSNPKYRAVWKYVHMREIWSSLGEHHWLRMIVPYEYCLANVRNNLSWAYTSISDVDCFILVTIDDGWSLLLEAKVTGPYGLAYIFYNM